MKYELTQADIDRLDDYEYAMFLDYGDTFRNQTSVPAGEGSDRLWPDEATRVLEDVRDEILLVGKRVRDSFNNRRFTWGYRSHR